MKGKRIAIIGGGVAGSTAALRLGQMGLDVTLFEQEQSLISGPPFCHLHAGGNLYREISDAQCVTLLRQSVAFLRYYPFIVDYRPTVITVPVEDKGTPEALLPRLKLLVAEYEKLITEDPANAVLGKSSDYYKPYTRAEMERLRTLPEVSQPKSCDEWMIPVAKVLDFERVQFPVILVQEYGLNLFRLSAGVTLALEAMEDVTLLLEHKVTDISRRKDGWLVTAQRGTKQIQSHFDYLINAAGFRTGRIDDMIGVPCQRMVEFKAAYVSRWAQGDKRHFPEVIFHGERGTPRGMGQFTPYPDGHFQLHGMTREITLYEEGLVANPPWSCQPQLKEDFLKKIEQQWQWQEVKTRTRNAIRHIARFIPDFADATVASKPLFGAQQIPGNDPDLRVAEVSFPAKRYARCEIVKVSSALDMVDAITADLAIHGLIEEAKVHERDPHIIDTLEDTHISTLAEQIAQMREYPAALGRRTIPKRFT